MGFGLSFQPGAQMTPGESRATTAALGPGQKALQILALHLPRIAGAPRGTSPRPSGLSPDMATFQSLVQALSDHPIGGYPETGPLVGALGNLPPEHTPTSLGGGGGGGDLLGPNGEWMPGQGELGPMVPEGQDVWGSLLAGLR